MLGSASAAERSGVGDYDCDCISSWHPPCRIIIILLRLMHAAVVGERRWLAREVIYRHGGGGGGDKEEEGSDGGWFVSVSAGLLAGYLSFVMIMISGFIADHGVIGYWVWVWVLYLYPIVESYTNRRE